MGGHAAGEGYGAFRRERNREAMRGRIMVFSKRKKISW